LVDTTGRYQQLGASVNYSFDIIKYWLSRDDPAQSKCYASSCHVSAPERSLNFTIKQKFSNQYTFDWIGQIKVEGANNPGQNGKGYANLVYRYSSEVYITNVTDNRVYLDMPTNPTTIKAKVMGTIIMQNVTIVYKVNSGAEHIVQMAIDLNESYQWKGVIPGGQTLHSKVEYKIVAIDRADKRTETEWYSYDIEVIVP
jgi:hypothetical protein